MQAVLDEELSVNKNLNSNKLTHVLGVGQSAYG